MSCLWLLSYLKNMKKYIFIAILGLLGTSASILFWPPGLGLLRLILGSFFVLFLPGLALSFVFLEDKNVDIIERVVLSFALSISVVPILVFYFNLIGMKITMFNVALIVVFIVLIGLWGKIRRKSKVQMSNDK